MTCNGCKWWVENTLIIEVLGGTVEANTYADFTNPSEEQVRVAQCSNEDTTNSIITRDVKSEYLFDAGGLLEDIKESNSVASGELDNCANFEI